MRKTDFEIAQIKADINRGTLSRQEIAKKHGVSDSYIGQIERGDRKANIPAADEPIMPAQVLAATQPDGRLEAMLDYYRKAMGDAVQAYVTKLDMTPLHEQIVNVMTVIYDLPYATIENLLEPSLEHLTITIGGDHD